MNDGKEFFKTLVLVLKDSSQENRKDELDRITREMKEDVARNIDNIIEHVERLRPAAESANYAQTILLYDEIVDDMQRLMESLEDTFTKIFEELNQIIDDLWQAISSENEAQVHQTRVRFQILLNSYTAQWNDVLTNANQKLVDFERKTN